MSHSQFPPGDPYVSVIVTCYNLENYIEKSIKSARTQVTDQQFEIIVVDDCSTDASPEIIKRCEGVRYLRTNKNGGVLRAMLAGIAASRGQIIALLDGDDLWNPGKLDAVEKAFSSDPSLALVTHDLIFIDHNGELISLCSRPHEVFQNLPASAVSEHVRSGILEHRDFVWLGSALCLHKTRTRLGEFCEWAATLPEAEDTYQDWPLAYWIAADPSVRLSYLPGRWLSYRLHGANHSGGAQPLARLIRNLHRNRNTLRAMHSIAVEQMDTHRYAKILESEIATADYLLSLFGSGWRTSFPGLLAALPDLRRRGLLIKEIVRFAGIAMFGPERFTEIARNRRIFRNLRPS